MSEPETKFLAQCEPDLKTYLKDHQDRHSSDFHEDLIGQNETAGMFTRLPSIRTADIHLRGDQDKHSWKVLQRLDKQMWPLVSSLQQTKAYHECSP